MKREKLPKAFVERMERLLPPEEFEGYLQSFDEKAYSALRVNSLKMTPERFCSMVDWQFEPVPWTKNGFYYQLPEEESASRHPFYYAGLYYLQEPSAMAPAQLLPIEPGDKVLDLCAAPGGKTTELGARLKGKGVLVCNDISASRAKALLKNVELFGIRNAVVLNETPERIKEHWKGYFDKILIDAPCSGEGMFRKEASMMKNWEDAGTESYVRLQTEILSSVPDMLKPGGMLLYSTCTFSPEEDEEQVQSLLDTGAFELIDIRNTPMYQERNLEQYFDTGHPEWMQDGSKVRNPELEGCIRLFPHRLKGEGHFVALLKKKESAQALSDSSWSKTEEETKKVRKNKNKPSKRNYRIPSCAEEFLSCVTFDSNGSFVMGNENLYRIPDDFPNLDGLHVIRSGLLLGTVKNYTQSTFEPAQALAMTLDEAHFSNCLNLSLQDERVKRFLKGESIEIPKELSGWCLVLLDGCPLGFGKAMKGQLKNKYNKGWRMM